MKVNLITGGAGFIGSNLADRLLGRGEAVTVFDDLSRPGSRLNLVWLQERHSGPNLRIFQGDIRDAGKVAEAARGVDRIYHFAGQTAVTRSIEDPHYDFEVNALGTVNALEAARQAGRAVAFFYASTNKVYGGLRRMAVREEAARYSFVDAPQGVSEEMPVDLHSPYGCSKAAGDQYASSYHRVYGLPTVVFRQSCIYGPRQMGSEDQGWVAWLALAASRGQPISIFGDGKQVRDLLYVDDLLDAFDAALERIETVAGEVFNIGGGTDSSISVWREFGPMLERALGKKFQVTHHGWRPGDQRVYVSDTRKAHSLLGWRPRVKLEQGLERLLAWLERYSEEIGP